MEMKASFRISAGDFSLQAKMDIADRRNGILGASGCGKSMTLKALAGILTPDEGRIELGDRVLFDSRAGINVPARERGIGYLFQNYALFPNMNTEQNIGAGLRGNKKEIRAKVKAIMERLRLTELSGHFPTQMSGGQQQRVALARILVRKPEVILLDEPFSALDYQTRLNVSDHICRIIREQGKTALLVTHDISEAVSMSDRIVVLSRRPATVKAVFDLGELKRLSPMERRDSSLFPGWFNRVWKELDLHG